MPPQVFHQSPTAESMEDLVKAWRGRTFPVGPSRKVTFAICGEINGFNPDGSAKNGRERELPFDILANPAHYIMGRWQHLGRKLSALSKGKVVIHVANNDRNHKNLTTDVRIYIDGRFPDDKVRCSGTLNLKWCECEI